MNTGPFHFLRYLAATVRPVSGGRRPGAIRARCSILRLFGILFCAGLPAGMQADPVAATHPYTEAQLVDLLTTTLQRDYVRDRGQLELTLKEPWTAPVLPAGPLTAHILEMPSVGVTSSFIIRFELAVGGTTLGTWQATVQAQVWRTVWVAHSNLRRGESITSADISRERTDILNVRDALAEFSPDDASREIAEPVSAGTPLIARMIKLRPVIHRGQLTNALVEDGALSITTKVEALEDGAPGQTIHARNPVSHRLLYGRVLDNQTILISL